MKYSHIKIPTPRAITPIFDHISPYIFLSTFNLWYQQAKKQAIFMLYSRGIFDIKTLQCNCRPSWHNTTEKQINRFTASKFG